MACLVSSPLSVFSPPAEQKRPLVFNDRGTVRREPTAGRPRLPVNFKSEGVFVSAVAFLAQADRLGFGAWISPQSTGVSGNRVRQQDGRRFALGALKRFRLTGKFSAKLFIDHTNDSAPRSRLSSDIIDMTSRTAWGSVYASRRA